MAGLVDKLFPQLGQLALRLGTSSHGDRPLQMPMQQMADESGQKRQAEQHVDGRPIGDARLRHVDGSEDERNGDDEEKRAEPPNVIQIVSQACVSETLFFRWCASAGPTYTTRFFASRVGGRPHCSRSELTFLPSEAALWRSSHSGGSPSRAEDVI